MLGYQGNARGFALTRDVRVAFRLLQRLPDRCLDGAADAARRFVPANVRFPSAP